MEPEDLPLPDLLDTHQTAGPDALRAIVAKAGRHRVRFASMAAGVALLVGGGVGGVIGYASSNHSNHAVQTASAPHASNTSSGLGTATSGGAASGGVATVAPTGVATVALTHEFTRTANGVDIRGYRVASDLIPPVNFRCSDLTSPRFQAEVSTDQAVGSVMSGFGFSSSSSTVKSVSSDVIGVGEGDPVGVVVASTSTGVKSVKVSFTGGATDQMAPSGGWVALAGPVPASTVKGTTTVRPQVGTLTAYDESGKQLFSQPVSIGFAGIGTVVPQPALCGCGGPILGPGPASPPGVVRPGLPTTNDATAPPARAGSPGFACPVTQGHAGSGSSSSGSGANG